MGKNTEPAFTSFHLRDRRSDNKGFYVVLNYRSGSAYREKSIALKATNKRDALKEAMSVFQAACENETDFLKDKYRLSTYAEEYFNRREKLADITLNTLTSYRGLMRHICSELKNPYIHHIKRKDIERWVSRMQDRGLKPESIAKSYNLLHLVLNDAVFYDLIAKNPVQGVKKPKKEARKINILEKEELKRLMDAMKHTGDLQLKALVIVGVTSGMRPAETCALTWNDVDETGLIHITRTVTRNGGEEYVHNQTKTAAGEREIYATEAVLSVLSQLKQKQQEECVTLGLPWHKGLYLLGYPDGRFFSPHAGSRKFRTLVRALGINGSTGAIPRLYDLRHTFATRALQAGVDIETIANSMGHANVAMTLNTYATSDTDAKKRLAQAMNDIF